MDLTSLQYDKKDLIKISDTWFKPHFLSALEQEQQQQQILTSYLTHCDFFFQKNRHLCSNGSQTWYIPKQTAQKIFDFVVQTQVQACNYIRPEKLLHIKFNNLKHLSLVELRLYNIEILQFMDFSNLQRLDLANQGQDQSLDDLNRLRSIRPLIKCQMPKIRSIDFECGSIKWMGRDISRIKTSQYLQYVGLENNEPKDDWPDHVRDEDMGIWSKAESKDIQYIRRLFFVQFPSDRIPQKSVEDCLKRKYESLQLDEKIDYSDYSDSQNGDEQPLD